MAVSLVSLAQLFGIATRTNRSARNGSLATILAELGQVCDQFAQHGFISLRAEWQGWHAHQDQAVQLLDEFAPPRQGICRGVSADGALLLETSAGLEQVLAGEVSLRRADA